MTRAEFLSAIARRTNKNTTLDTATQNRLVDFLNERHRRILSRPGMSRLRQASILIASVADQVQYTIRNIHKIRAIVDTTNDRRLQEMTLAAYRHIDPDPHTGTPTHFVWMGHQEAVDKQPSNASTLVCTSTSGSDTTQTVYIEGVVSGNLPYSTSASLNGTSSVTLGAVSWVRVDAFYLSAAAAGYVALYEDTTSGTEMASIMPGQTRNRYTRFALWPTPSASSIIYAVDVERAITGLAQNTDEPDLPDDFHDLLLLGALMDEYQHMNDPRYEVARQEYQQRERAFVYWLAETATGESGIDVFRHADRLGIATT